jgi:hypothetical protein
MGIPLKMPVSRAARSNTIKGLTLNLDPIKMMNRIAPAISNKSEGPETISMLNKICIYR